MKNLILLSFSLVLFYACGSGGTSSGPAAPADLQGFEMANVAGSSVQKAMKKDGNGNPVEDGQVLNGKKTGTWVVYHRGEDVSRVKSLTTYVGGKKEGLHMEFSNRGQMEVQANYANDALHGQKLKFKFGHRVEEESNYNNGVLDGVYKFYHGNGSPQKEIHYKNGKQHGAFIYYNEEGQKTLEYEYKNGEKVSGGMVEQGEKKE